LLYNENTHIELLSLHERKHHLSKLNTSMLDIFGGAQTNLQVHTTANHKLASSRW